MLLKPPKVSTQRLQCSSFLVMTYFLLKDYNILAKKELHSSLWVKTAVNIGLPSAWPWLMPSAKAKAIIIVVNDLKNQINHKIGVIFHILL